MNKSYLVFLYSGLFFMGFISLASAQTPAYGLPGEAVPGQLLVMFHEAPEIEKFEKENRVLGLSLIHI